MCIQPYWNGAETLVYICYWTTTHISSSAAMMWNCHQRQHWHWYPRYLQLCCLQQCDFHPAICWWPLMDSVEIFHMSRNQTSDLIRHLSWWHLSNSEEAVGMCPWEYWLAFCQALSSTFLQSFAMLFSWDGKSWRLTADKGELSLLEEIQMLCCSSHRHRLLLLINERTSCHQSTVFLPDSFLVYGITMFWNQSEKQNMSNFCFDCIVYHLDLLMSKCHTCLSLCRQRMAEAWYHQLCQHT